MKKLRLLCPQQVNIRKHQNSGLWLSAVLIPWLHLEAYAYVLGIVSSAYPTVFPVWVLVSLSSALLRCRFVPQLQLLAAVSCWTHQVHQQLQSCFCFAKVIKIIGEPACILKCRRGRECAACTSAQTLCPPMPACGCISHLAALLQQSKSPSATASSDRHEGIATRALWAEGNTVFKRQVCAVQTEIQLTAKRQFAEVYCNVLCRFLVDLRFFPLH